MRVCLVSQQADDSCEVMGTALIKLDAHVGQHKTERWYDLQQGSERSGAKIGHIRVRTVWTPSQNDLQEAITAVQEPQQVSITFLDGTQVAASNSSLTNLTPFFKQELSHCEALMFDPRDFSSSPMY